MLSRRLSENGCDTRRIGFLIRGRLGEQRNRGEFEGITLIVCHRRLSRRNTRRNTKAFARIVQVLSIVEAKDSLCWTIICAWL
jgi:hypothetical protein